MIPDPIVEEMRKNLASFAEAHHGDIHEMAEAIRRREKEHADRIVDRAAILRQRMQQSFPASKNLPS